MQTYRRLHSAVLGERHVHRDEAVLFVGLLGDHGHVLAVDAERPHLGQRALALADEVIGADVVVLD